MPTMNYSCSSTWARKFLITRENEMVFIDSKHIFIFEPLPHIQ